MYYTQRPNDPWARIVQLLTSFHYSSTFPRIPRSGRTVAREVPCRNLSDAEGGASGLCQPLYLPAIFLDWICLTFVTCAVTARLVTIRHEEDHIAARAIRCLAVVCSDAQTHGLPGTTARS